MEKYNFIMKKNINHRCIYNTIIVIQVNNFNYYIIKFSI